MWQKKCFKSPILSLLLCVWGCLAGVGAVAETITMGGVGSITPLVQRLAQQYEATHPGVVIRVVDPPVGSTGGMRALAAGACDLVVVGRELRPGEQGQVTPWLQTPLVLATRGGRMAGLDLPVLVQIFTGQRKQWDDGQPIRLILRASFESETLLLSRLSPEMARAVSQALQGRQALMADNDLDALDKLQKIKGSLGTTSWGLLRSTGADLTVLPLQGQPHGGASASPWLRQYFLVQRPDASPAVRQWLAYLQSAPARALAESLGYLPLRP
jgi:phosphate transport system substrate-binding protein